MEFLPSLVYNVSIGFSSSSSAPLPLSLVFWTPQKVVGSKHERERQERIKESPRKERSVSCCSTPTQNAGLGHTSTRRRSWRGRLQNEKKQWIISELDHRERREQQSPDSGAVISDSNSDTVRRPENLRSIFST
ncbi:hypothetical protein BHM03_00052773 [Ensete ventricosum]|nr:hypothetical protein BHM03_00052773 [Ensete ventricosum]